MCNHSPTSTRFSKGSTSTTWQHQGGGIYGHQTRQGCHLRPTLQTCPCLRTRSASKTPTIAKIASKIAHFGVPVCPDPIWPFCTPEGKDLWLRMDTGQMQYSSPFLTEVKEEATDQAGEQKVAFGAEATDPSSDIVRPEVVEFQLPADQPVQGRDSLTKTVPKAIVPNKVVLNTSGAQYERWKQATSKELQAFSRLLGRNLHQNFKHVILLPKRWSSSNFSCSALSL